MLYTNFIMKDVNFINTIATDKQISGGNIAQINNKFAGKTLSLLFKSKNTITNKNPRDNIKLIL